MRETNLENPVPMSKTKRLWLTVAGIVLFFFLMLLLNGFAEMPFITVFERVAKEGGIHALLVLILRETLMLISVFVSAFIVLRIRKIPLTHIGLSVRWKEIILGFLFVLVLYLLGFGFSLLIGTVEIAEVRFQFPFLLINLLFFLLVAVAEEVAMRGFVLGHLLDGGINKFGALLISSILFSLMHLFNPNFAFVPFLNIVLAGLFLGASYLYTRNLSLAIGLHWFWNWIQGPVLGYEVSGNKFTESLITLRLPEENLINGGAFGFEGSVVCTILLVAGTLLILRHYAVKK